MIRLSVGVVSQVDRSVGRRGQSVRSVWSVSQVGHSVSEGGQLVGLSHLVRN